MECRPHYRIVLLGPCGCGKSAFGNTLINRIVFESRKSLTSSSVTKCLQKENTEYQGESFQIIDTPCFSEIARSKTLSKTFFEDFRTGYDVIAIVVPLERLTTSTEKIFDGILKKCNLHQGDPIIIVYTKGEESIDIVPEFLIDSNSGVLNKIRKLSRGQYYISIDNTSDEDRIKKRSKFLLMSASLAKQGRPKRHIISVNHKILLLFLACVFILACICIVFGITRIIQKVLL